ncbi:MAG: hypothetical protein JJE07_13770 [Flavobacteriaceae bacterium]|nr:hypothetical protein [Flavobacteriaceae bacterium]
MEAIKFKVYPRNREQIEAIKTIFKAFKIKFEVEEEKLYNPKFVERVLLAKEEIEQGKGVKIDTKDLWK